MSHLKGDWLLVTLQWEHWGGGQGWKQGEWSPLNPSLIWTYSIVLCNIVNSQRNGVGATFVYRSRATAWCVLRDLLGFMHNALCVSWEGWTSDREDWVPSRISNGLRSLSPPPRVALSLFYTVRWKQPTSLMWPFSCVWHENKGSAVP